MSKRKIVVLVIGLYTAFSAFTCQQVKAQVFTDPVIQNNYDKIGRLQTLKYWNQRPANYHHVNSNSNYPGNLPQDEMALRQRLDDALLANDKGLEFYKNHDWANAVASFQQAADKNPDDEFFQENLIKAKAKLLVQRDDQARLQQQEQQNKAAAINMQQTVNSSTQTLNVPPSPGTVDFDRHNSNNSSNSNGSSLGFMSGASNTVGALTGTGLQSGDPGVAGARHVPSGLPKSVDNAIAGAYSNAPAGVGDRVRKGFQAVTDRDWKLAKAWFGDALHHDPGNAGLKRLVELADYTGNRIAQGKPDNTNVKPLTNATAVLPKVSDIKYLFPDWEPVQPKLPATGKTMELPEDSDIKFLFPDIPPNLAREMNDYIFEQAIKMTENDPVLIKLSNGAGHLDPKLPVN